MKRVTPPGTKEIEENVYVDKNEISISGYALYLQWTKIVYGGESNDYRRAMPDSSLISQNILDSLIFKPFLYDLPIVGISYKQAKTYTEWRTNRVAEMLLIKHRRVKMNRHSTPDNQFTLEKYLADKYEFVTKKEKLHNFPIYTIPYESEWKKYIYQGIVDSLINEGHVLEIVVVKDGSKQSKIKSIQTDTSIDTTITFINKPVGQGNSYTGFRNICRWKSFN